MRRRDLVNLLLRVTMECGVVAGLAFWGVHSGGGTGTKILYGVAAPALGFGFWGAVDFHQLGRLSELVRLIQELVVSGLAAAAWYAAGQHALGLALAALSLVYHALVYTTGMRLLEAKVPEEAAAVGAGDS